MKKFIAIFLTCWLALLSWTQQQLWQSMPRLVRFCIRKTSIKSCQLLQSANY